MQIPPNRLRYSPSRNLIHPEPKIEIVEAENWRKDPPNKKGYYLVKDSLHQGVSEVSGYGYQYYTLAKLGRDSGDYAYLHKNGG